MAKVAGKTVSRATKRSQAALVPVTYSEALATTTTLAAQPVLITEAVKAVVNLSDEQLAIAQAVQNGTGNIVVRARAGTGKTYLLRRCVPLMFGEIAIAAYNRKIAREIRNKLVEDGHAQRTWAEVRAQRDGLDVGTFHSFGWRVLLNSLKGVRLEGKGKDQAGFYKFDRLCERLQISKPLQSLVRRAMERGQERLLELPNHQAAAQATAVATKASIQTFLDEVARSEGPQWGELARKIAARFAERGFITEGELRSTKMAARNAKRSLPAGLPVGFENRIIIENKPATQTDGLDPAWLDLAKHHGFELDLPADDHIEMQLLRGTMPRGTTPEQVREAMLHKCLKLAAKAIHESAKMASETFRAQRNVKGRIIEGEEFTGVCSFAEMLYLPIYLNLTIPQYDFVCVDEAQDSNPARREFARRMLKATGRIIFVGDDRQAIYGWAGADNDALDQIIEQFNCDVFPMTTTFRCGKAIVALAQEIVPDYRAADTNPEGAVDYIDEKEFQAIDMEPTDAIICRNTAPLVKHAYKLIARGVACHVEGKDIGKRLLPLLYRWSSIKNVGPYVTKLTEYRDSENAKLMAQDMEAAAEELNDRVDTILAIVEFLPKNSTVADIQAHVEKLFSDDAEGDEAPANVTLITAHRAKGLEFPRVFGLGVNKFMPSPYAKSDWARKQEENLEYVLKTRAIHEYIEVAVV